MLTETGTVTSVNNDSVWVETIQQSTCGSCRARKGCGQRLLSSTGIGSASVKALIDKNDTTKYSVGDVVNIAIPEHIIVVSSLLVYCLPLLLLVVFSGVAHTYFMADSILIVAGVLGLLSGAYIIRLHGLRYKNDPRYQPTVVAPESLVSGVVIYSAKK
ncbi:SoxR reducing system RseC family protein [Eionea flava]